MQAHTRIKIRCNDIHISEKSRAEKMVYHDGSSEHDWLEIEIQNKRKSYHESKWVKETQIPVLLLIDITFSSVCSVLIYVFL